MLGEASEAEQAIRLLKEISPVSSSDYCEAYEERFGVRQGSAQGNITISNALSAYYSDGQYSMNVPVIDERDVQQVITALREKDIWFIDDIDGFFDKICKYTSHDAINAAAFRRIGYTLNSSYVYCSSYGTTLNFFEETVFSKDVVDFTTLDRRMINLGMFAAALDKKKKALEYIETAPKVFMSIEKVQAVYGLTIEEIRELQSLMSIFYDTPFFNGRSLWTEVSDFAMLDAVRQRSSCVLACKPPAAFDGSKKLCGRFPQSFRVYWRMRDYPSVLASIFSIATISGLLKILSSTSELSPACCTCSSTALSCASGTIFTPFPP